MHDQDWPKWKYMNWQITVLTIQNKLQYLQWFEKTLHSPQKNKKQKKPSGGKYWSILYFVYFCCSILYYMLYVIAISGHIGLLSQDYAPETQEHGCDLWWLSIFKIGR